MKEFAVQNPNITFHHVFPGLIRTNGAENQGFHPIIVTLGGLAGKLFFTEPDAYSDVPVAKAVSGQGGLSLTGSWGWKIGLEKWAMDPEKRRTLFEWSLNRARMAAKQSQINTETKITSA